MQTLLVMIRGGACVFKRSTEVLTVKPALVNIEFVRKEFLHRLPSMSPSRKRFKVASHITHTKAKLTWRWLLPMVFFIHGFLYKWELSSPPRIVSGWTRTGNRLRTHNEAQNFLHLFLVTVFRQSTKFIFIKVWKYSSSE